MTAYQKQHKTDMDKIEMAKAYSSGFDPQYREVAYDAFLCGYDAKCDAPFSKEPVCLYDGEAPSKQKCGDCTIACSVRVEEEPDDYTNFTQKEVHSQGYDEAYLNDCIAKASKSWKGVDVDKFMDEVRGREPDKSLEDVAEKWSGLDDCHTEVESFYASLNKVAVIAGAKWQKEQMMKEAVEGYVTLTMTGIPTVAATIKEGDNIGVGDKVRIIIIKDDGKSD